MVVILGNDFILVGVDAVCLDALGSCSDNVDVVGCRVSCSRFFYSK